MLLLSTAGCAYHGESTTDTDNPLVRKFTWFSFLDGNDIRESCASLGAQAPAHYRLVYNGQYDEQVRAYEINGTPSGGGALQTRARGRTNLANWWIRDSADLLAPWRWQQATAALSPAEMAEFRTQLAQSGFGSGAPQGLRLYSNDFYWTAAGCEAGQFHFFAWPARNGSLEAARFQDFLLRHDGTGLPVRAPHTLSAEERARPRAGNDSRNASSSFTVEVRGEGLGGLVNAF